MNPAPVTSLLARAGPLHREVDLGGNVTPADIFAIAVEGNPAEIGEAARSRMACASGLTDGILRMHDGSKVSDAVLSAGDAYSRPAGVQHESIRKCGVPATARCNRA